VVPQLANLGDGIGSEKAEACCGGGGGEGPGVVWEPLPGACVSFSASSTSVPYGGDNVTLTWKGIGESANLEGYGAVNVSGSKTVHVSKDTTFRLIVSGPGGQTGCTVTIKVDPPKK